MIREIAVAALALGGLSLSPLTVASAQTGFLCGFASFTDPTVEGDVQTGLILGGPLFAADVDNPGEETADISIRCTIQVGTQGATHAGVDGYTITSLSSPGVAVLPPTQFTYVGPVGAAIYMCTAAIVGGQIRYFDVPGEGAPNGWSLSSSANCSLAISQELPSATGEELDPYICPPLAVLFPPDGDITGWDCPPYDSSERPDPPEDPEPSEAPKQVNADPWMIGCIDTDDGAICT